MLIFVTFTPSCIHIPQYDRYAFHRINSFPLVVDYNNILSAARNPDSRHYGANPLAFKLLMNSFGYELIHCDSTGVSCIFVHQSVLPQTCPIYFPLPSLTYPLLRAIENKTSGAPLVLSEILLQRLMGEPFNHVFADVTFMKTQHFVDTGIEYTATWNTNYQRFVSQEEFGYMTTAGACLVDHSCADVNTTLQFRLSLFQIYREQNFHPDIAIATDSVEWLCSHLLMRHLHDEHSSMCVEISDLYFQQVLFALSTRYPMVEVLVLIQEGFKFNPHNLKMKAVYRYHNWNNFIVKTAVVPIYSLSMTFIGGIDQHRGIGAGICDNILHRLDNDRVFRSLSAVFPDRLFSVERAFVSHLIPEAQYTAHRPVDEISKAQPYFKYADTVLHALIPPGYRESALVESAKGIVQDICSRRGQQQTILVFGPEMSGTEAIQELFQLKYINENKTEGLGLGLQRNFSALNSDIIQSVGCNPGVTLHETCQDALRTLSGGYFQPVEGMDTYWKDVTQQIYQQRLQCSEEAVFIIDPLLSFTAPLWQPPLGTVEIVLVLQRPREAIHCLSRAKHITLHEALSLWILYFKSVLSSSSSFERIHLMEYNSGSSMEALKRTMQEMDVFAALFPDEEDFSVDNVYASGPGAVSDDSEFLSIPNWIEACYDFLFHEKYISSELCLSH